MKRWEKQSGFTIVELLIVIVVIGILAAITIVAYNGISSRSENTKTVNSVGAYARAIAAYAPLNNSLYPIAAYPCLGPSGTSCGNMTDTAGSCNGAGSASFSATFDTMIKTVATALPAPSLQKSLCGTKLYGGAWYNSADGKNAVINYYLSGDVPCVTPSGTALNQRTQESGTTVCRVTMPVIP